MWSGLTFDSTQVVDQALSLINQFMPLVYIVGAVSVFGLVMFVVIAIGKRVAS